MTIHSATRIQVCFYFGLPYFREWGLPYYDVGQILADSAKRSSLNPTRVQSMMFPVIGDRGAYSCLSSCVATNGSRTLVLSKIS